MKKYLTLIILIILIAVVAGGIYLAKANRKNIAPLPSGNNQSSQPTEQLPPPENQNTSNSGQTSDNSSTSPSVQPQINPVTIPVVPPPKPPVNTEPSQGAPKEASVSIENFSFSPATLTIKSGTKVAWINQDSVPHQIVADSASNLSGLISGALSQGQSYSFTFTKTGTFGYHCQIHPSMTGTIIVE